MGNDKEKKVVQAHEYTKVTQNYEWLLKHVLAASTLYAFQENDHWDIYVESITTEYHDEKGITRFVLEDRGKREELNRKVKGKNGSGFSKKEKEEWFGKMDLQAMLKPLVYGPKKDECLRIYRERNNISGQVNDFRTIILNLIVWRNRNFAHLGPSHFEKYGSEKFENEITKPVDVFIRKLKNSPDQKVKELCQEWQEYVENARERLGYPPIKLDELAKERGEEEGKLKANLIKGGFLIEKGYISGVSKKKILEYLKIVQPIINGKGENAVKLLRPFRILNSIKTPKIRTEELKEVIEDFALVLDSTALLSEDFLRYIRVNIEPYMAQKKKIFLVDRATRRDLREKEKRYYQTQEMLTGLRHCVQQGTISDEELQYLEGLSTCENSNRHAKTALIYLDELARKGMVTYYDADDVMGDEEENIIEVIEKYNTRRICVLSLNNFLVSRLEECNNKNVIAIRSVLGSGFIWKNFLCRLNPTLEQTAQENEKKLIGQTEQKRIVQKEEPLELKGTNLGRVEAGKHLYDSKGRMIKLCNRVGEGGEGAVYTVPENDKVAKVYFDNRLTKQRFEKMQKMVEKKIHVEGVCWPIEILYDKDKNFRGYLMPKVPSECYELGLSVLKLSSKGVREKIMPGWDRLSLVRLSIAICQLFALLHEQDILMGDVNPRNIMINPKKPEQVWFVDCDSYQFGKYKCPVGTNIFTSPRIYKKYGKEPEYNSFFREEKDEQYAIASLLFQILMVGQSPFASKRQDNSDMIDAICNHVFGYSRDTDEEVVEGPYKMIWNNMNYSLKKRFENVFAGGEFFSEKEWERELKNYLHLIEEKKSVNELFPTRYKSIGDGQFVDFTCAMCGKRTNMELNKYKKKTEKNQQIYCNECQAFVNRLKNRPAIVQCKRCHKEIKTTEFMDFMSYRDPEFVIKCPECGNRNRRK